MWRPSLPLGARNADLATQVGASASMGARIWRLLPGQAGVLHRHRSTQELYVVLAGTGRIRIDGTEHTLAPLSAVNVEPAELRQVFNDTDHEAVWLIAGAPPETLDAATLSDELKAFMYPQGWLVGGPAELFVDLASAECAWAVADFERVVGRRPVLQPVLFEDTHRDAMLAATWAARHGLGDAFLRAASAAAFPAGADPAAAGEADLADGAVLRSIAAAVGLDASALDAGLASPAVAEELRIATERARALGVTRVPTTRFDGELYEDLAAVPRS